jgi:hypothetical protein
MSQPPAGRALLLLAAAEPDPSRAGLAELPVGERNRRLLRLRERLFGSDVSSVVDCPACRGRLELLFPASLVRSSSSVLAEDSFGLKAGGYEVRFRLANSRDLLELPAGDVPGARRWLAERCIAVVEKRGKRGARDQLPGAVVDALARRMAEADPDAVVELAVECPACGHRWGTLFDIASFLWEELDQWARRLLRDEHRLAAAHGWNEDDVLRLSPWRRQAYLDMLPA